jgi:3-mercaptopyruvate sulfurtransferase SseA
VRVAYRLQQLGIPVAVIQGGLSAWSKARLPVEPVPAGEIAELPLFQ